MTTTAPARSDSPTNLRHEEASWRSSVCQVPSTHVAVDITGATVRHEAAFGVRCLMSRFDFVERDEVLRRINDLFLVHFPANIYTDMKGTPERAEGSVL